MDLKKVYEELFSLLKIESFDKMSFRINEIINSNEKNEFVKKYQEFSFEFNFDPIQKAYQFYCADRENEGQDFTPPCIADLISKLAIRPTDKLVMDVCAGIGALTRSVHENFKGKEFICLELDDEIIPILIFIFFCYNIDGKIIHTNVLTREVFAEYIIKNGEIINEIFTDNYLPEAVISNPPYNLKTTPKENFLSNNANYSFVYESLLNSSEDARLAFVLPGGVLNNNDEKKSREYLIQNNLIEAVITLPDRMFDITSIPVCILLINKNKSHEFITLINHAKTHEFEVIKKQGEGTKRVYSKVRNFITQSHIDNIYDIIENGRDSDISRRHTKEEIVNNDYALSPSRYDPIGFSSPTDDRPIEHILTDLNRVISHKNNVKLTINETIARDSGMLEVHRLMKESNEKTQQLNNFLEIMNFQKIQDYKYLQLTKTKGEIKLEQDKSGFSSIMQMNLPVWKHQIHFLNNEENRLLAEVRDWLLPRLMNGEIDVSEMNLATSENE